MALRLINKILTMQIKCFGNNARYLPSKSILLQQFCEGKCIEDAFTFHKLFKLG